MLIHSQSKEVQLCQADTVKKDHHQPQQESDGQQDLHVNS